MSRSEAPEPSIRGSYVNTSKSWIMKTYGEDLFRRVVTGLPKEHQAYLGVIVSTSWYPLRTWTKVLEGVRAEVRKKSGEDERTFDRRNLNESIGAAMKVIYRLAFSVLDPTTVIAKVTPMFQRVYSHGEYEVVKNEPGMCLLRFRDAPAEMLPELQRSFPIAAGWMLETAGQTVTKEAFTPHVNGPAFSCDLELHYHKGK